MLPFTPLAAPVCWAALDYALAFLGYRLDRLSPSEADTLR